MMTTKELREMVEYLTNPVEAKHLTQKIKAEVTIALFNDSYVNQQDISKFNAGKITLNQVLENAKAEETRRKDI